MFFHKTTSHPHLIFVQLIILTLMWVFGCAVIRLHPVPSEHFSTFFSSCWWQSMLPACTQPLPCCWYPYIYAAPHASHLWKYWKCQTRADASICLTYRNLSWIFKEELEELLSSIALKNQHDLLKEMKKVSLGIGVDVQGSEQLTPVHADRLTNTAKEGEEQNSSGQLLLFLSLPTHTAIKWPDESRTSSCANLCQITAAEPPDSCLESCKSKAFHTYEVKLKSKFLH